MNRHFGGKRIVCLGGLHIDRTTRFLAQPVWGRSNPVSGVRTVGGVAHNVAANLRHVDWDVLMSSALGQDADSEAALRGLQVSQA